MEDAILVIGLGNPGADYEKTYHNVGALAVETIAAKFAQNIRWNAHRKLFLSLRSGPWIFMRPLVFMNESGNAVREAIRLFSVLPQNIVLIHDDSDLPIGTWKLSRGKGAAGHHGVESVIATIGTDQFMRVRVGIRPAKERIRQKAGTFVLKKISKTSMRVFQNLFVQIGHTIENEPHHPKA